MFKTSLSMRAVSPEPSLLSHLRKLGLHTVNSFSQCSDEPYCVQSCQSLHCSRTCTKWAYIYSVNAQTRLNIHTVLLEPSLLSHIQKMGVFMAYFISQCSNKPKQACSITRAFTALAHVQNGLTYRIFFQSMLR